MSMARSAERASDVGVDQARHVARLRREALHAQLLVEEDRRDLDAVDQVQQVVVRLLERLELLRELRVHGVQLLVERLRLLLRGLQLFVRALQLLVDGLHFLVRRGELLIRRLELVDRALEIRVACSGARPRAARADRIGSRPRRTCPSSHRARGCGRRSRRRRAAADARDSRRRCARRPDAARAGLPGCRRRAGRSTCDAFDLSSVAQRGGERCAHAFARHLDDVQVRAAGRQLEEVADLTVDLLDLAASVDHHGRRPEALGEMPVQQVCQIGGAWPRRETCAAALAACAAGPRRSVQRSGGVEPGESLRRKSFQRLSSGEKNFSEPLIVSPAPSSRSPPGFRL